VTCLRPPCPPATFKRNWVTSAAKYSFATERYGQPSSELGRRQQGVLSDWQFPPGGPQNTSGNLRKTAEPSEVFRYWFQESFLAVQCFHGVKVKASVCGSNHSRSVYIHADTCLVN
jgi:hypothetical protein